MGDQRRSLADLQESARRLLRRYEQTGDTAHLHRMAEDMAQMRALCRTGDGHTDWAGRSAEYRTALREVTDAVPRPVWERARTVIYNQITQAIRSIAPPEDLIALGMSTTTRHERMRERRQRVSRIVQAATGAADRNPARVVAGVEALLDQVDTAQLPRRGEDDAADLADMLRSIVDRAHHLLSVVTAERAAQ